MTDQFLPQIKTDASARAAKPHALQRQVEYRVTGLRGLALRVTREGKKTWSLRYRNRCGQQKRQTLGTYPEVGLATARSAAKIVLGAVAGGADPAKEQRDAKAAAKDRKLSTVSGLIEEYFDAAAKGKHRHNARPKRASTMANERYYYERHIKKALGSRPMAELSRLEVQRLVGSIESASSAGARITRNVIRQAFNFAMMAEATDRNPAARINVIRWADRERVLSDHELRAVWRACAAPNIIPDLQLSTGMALALQLAMVTLQRGGEICGIHAQEIDRDGRVWTIPGNRTKNHRTHVVPLSSVAMDVLERAFDLTAVRGADDWHGFAFPSPRDHRKPVTRHALSRAMRRVCDHEAVSIADATPHDFRRTGSTNITGERIGIARFVVSRVLNQITDTGGAAAVTAVYDRNEYLAEKRRTLEAWANLLAEIVSPNDPPRSCPTAVFPCAAMFALSDRPFDPMYRG